MFHTLIEIQEISSLKIGICLFVQKLLSCTYSRAYSITIRSMEMNVWIVPADDANNGLSIR
jgi:hypothetical protein